MAAQPITHVEIPADDPAAASKFYNETFGWNLHHDPQFDYHMFSAEGGPGGGWVSTSGEYAAKVGHVLVYIDSTDIDADLARVEANGGKVADPKMELPGTGWMAVFTDPTGNRIGLFQWLNPPQR